MLVPLDPFAPIETDRLCLRCVREDDAAAIARMMTDPISRRLASWPVPYTIDMAVRRIDEARAAARERRMLPLIILHRQTRQPLGWISVTPTPADARLGMLTYWLGEAYHGQGIMREAAPPAVEAAFRELDLHAIRAAVQSDNVASLAVIRRLGASLLGAGHIHVPARDRDEDCLYWELSRPAPTRAAASTEAVTRLAS